MLRLFRHLRLVWSPKPIIAACLLAQISAPAWSQGEVLNYSLTHAGYARNYTLYVPSGYTPGNNTPLVFNLHGGNDPNWIKGKDQMAWTGMNVLADREGFLTVYPDARLGGWWGPNGIDQYDDAGFFDDMIADLATRFSVDTSRIYVTGLSHGALMTHILATARPYTFAAAAAVAGDRPYWPATTTYAPLDLPATPGRPFPFLHIHGTADQSIPYNGGVSLGWTWPPVEQVMGEYADNNGAAATPSVSDLPNINTADNSTVQVLTYGNPDTYLDLDGNSHEAETLLYRIVGGGHNWPDMVAPERNPPVNRDINANEVIWDFFSRHVVAAKPLPGDYNGDCAVDGRDFLIWQRSLGSTIGLYASADGNGDGVVDANDLAVWQEHYGTAGPAATGAFIPVTVPEPTTLVLALVWGMLAIAARCPSASSLDFRCMR